MVYVVMLSPPAIIPQLLPDSLDSAVSINYGIVADIFAPPGGIAIYNLWSCGPNTMIF
jgi:hypothetical protein